MIQSRFWLSARVKIGSGGHSSIRDAYSAGSTEPEFGRSSDAPLAEGTEKAIPRHVRDAESRLWILEMVDHVIPLQALPVLRFGAVVVQPIVRAVIKDVAEDEASVERPGESPQHGIKDPKENEVEREAHCRRHDESVLVSRPSVMDSMHQKVHSFSELPRWLPVKEQAMQPVFDESPKHEPRHGEAHRVNEARVGPKDTVGEHEQ